MCKYHIVILDTLVALECAFLVARCNIIRLYKKPRRKDWVTEKSTLKSITFAAAHRPAYITFCRFFRLLPPFPLLQVYEEKKIFAPERSLCVCVCLLFVAGALCPPVSTPLLYAWCYVLSVSWWHVSVVLSCKLSWMSCLTTVYHKCKTWTS